MVDTHSYRLSPLGPALQFGGGSRVISANSFWMRLADVPNAFEIFGFGFGSLVSDEPLLLVVATVTRATPEEIGPELFCWTTGTAFLFRLFPVVVPPPVPTPLLVEPLAPDDILRVERVYLGLGWVFSSTWNYFKTGKG